MTSNRPWCKVLASGSHHLLNGRVIALDVDAKVLVNIGNEAVAFDPKDLELYPVAGTGGTPSVGCMVEVCTDRGEPLGVKRGQLGRVTEVDLAGLRAKVRTRGHTTVVTAWAPFDELHVIGDV